MICFPFWKTTSIPTSGLLSSDLHSMFHLNHLQFLNYLTILCVFLLPSIKMFKISTLFSLQFFIKLSTKYCHFISDFGDGNLDLLFYFSSTSSSLWRVMAPHGETIWIHPFISLLFN